MLNNNNDSFDDVIMQENEQIIKQTTSSLVHLYARTRVRISINYDFVDFSNDREIGPDVNIDDLLRYGNKLSVRIDNLPKFEGECTYFIFSLQCRDDYSSRELFRCPCDASKDCYSFKNIFIDFKDAMSTLINHTRIIVTHCSSVRPWCQAVHFEAEIKGS